MTERLIADLLLILHLTFIVFVGLGGLLVIRWRIFALVHIPAFTWGVLISFFGWSCPLTSLEKEYRTRAGGAGFEGGFVEHYLIPIIYPERMTGELPSGFFIAIGIFVLLLNSYIYWKIIRKR